MKVSGRAVKRWLQSMVQDMYLNNRSRIICLCRKCKLIVILDPFDRGSLKVHLLMHGFRDGYTRWIIEDDDEDVHMAGNNDMGLDEEMANNDGPGDEGAGHGGGEEDVQGREEAIHGEDEARHDREEADTPQSSM